MVERIEIDLVAVASASANNRMQFHKKTFFCLIQLVCINELTSNIPCFIKYFKAPGQTMFCTIRCKTKFPSHYLERTP